MAMIVVRSLVACTPGGGGERELGDFRNFFRKYLKSLNAHTLSLMFKIKRVQFVGVYVKNNTAVCTDCVQRTSQESSENWLLVLPYKAI
jgi:hypothetical protein